MTSIAFDCLALNTNSTSSLKTSLWLIKVRYTGGGTGSLQKTSCFPPPFNFLLTDSSEPNPAEDAAARAKEEQEQASLPYKWQQTISELDVTFTVPGNLKSRDLVIEIKKKSLVAGIKGQDPIIKVTPPTPDLITIQHIANTHLLGRTPSRGPRRRLYLDALYQLG